MVGHSFCLAFSLAGQYDSLMPLIVNIYIHVYLQNFDQRMKQVSVMLQYF